MCLELQSHKSYINNHFIIDNISQMNSAMLEEFPVFQNQRLSSNSNLVISILRQQQKNLIGTLEYALNLNKQLILQKLIYTKTSDFSKQIVNYTSDTKETLKIVEECNMDQDYKYRKKHVIRKFRLGKKKECYDTKNIPKNFGTAIHIFIKKNPSKVKNLLSKHKISYSQFYQFNKEAKEKINSLLHLRELWEHKEGDNEAKLKECYRILSFQFMRRHCLAYVFGSRIKNTSSHIRYRKKLLEGIERPHTLFNLKDY